MFEVLKGAFSRRLLLLFIVLSIIPTSVLVVIQQLVRVNQQATAVVELQNTLQINAINTFSNLVTTKANHYAQRFELRATQIFIAEKMLPQSTSQNLSDFATWVFEQDPAALLVKINTEENQFCLASNLSAIQCSQNQTSIFIQESNEIQWSVIEDSTVRMSLLIGLLETRNGSVQIVYDFAEIIDEVPRFGIAPQSTLLLIDRTGKILGIPSWGKDVGVLQTINKSQQEIINQPLQSVLTTEMSELFSSENINNIYNSTNPTIKNTEINGNTVYFSLLSVPETPFLVTLMLPLNDIYAQAKFYGATLSKTDFYSTLLQSLLFVLGFFSVIIIGAIITLREMARPIKILQEGASALTNNQLDTRVPNVGTGEIKVLAEAFNTMADSIQTSQQNLENKQIELEQSLKMRLEELDAMNDTIALTNENTDLPQKSNKTLIILNEILHFYSAKIYLLEPNGNFTLIAQMQPEETVASNDINLIETEIPITFSGTKIGKIKYNRVENLPLEDFHQDFVIALATTFGVVIKNTELQNQARTMVISRERRHFARELHDSVTQSLFSASLATEGLSATLVNIEDPSVKRALKLLQDQLGQVRSQMRGLILELRPVDLENQSLEEAIQGHASSLERATSLHVSFNMQGCIECLSNEIQVSLNRIVQEALSNVARHASASQVWITLDCAQDSVLLTIRDDGQGFDTDENKIKIGSYGLMNIRERAIIFGGSTEINSAPGKGTTILVEIPLNSNTEVNHVR